MGLLDFLFADPEEIRYVASYYRPYGTDGVDPCSDQSSFPDVLELGGIAVAYAYDFIARPFEGFFARRYQRNNDEENSPVSLI